MNELIKIANVDKHISEKIANYNNMFENFKVVVVDFKEESGYELTDKQKAKLDYMRRKLEELLLEIEEDNIIFFFGHLHEVVSDLAEKLKSIEY